MAPPAHGSMVDLYGSVDLRFDDRRKCVARSVQPRLHPPQVAVGDLSDLLVRLALELTEHEHLTVMLGQLRHRVLDQLAQMALAIHVVRTRRGILELERSLLVFPVRLDRLKEHERIARAIAQL